MGANTTAPPPRATIVHGRATMLALAPAARPYPAAMQFDPPCRDDITTLGIVLFLVRAGELVPRSGSTAWDA